MIAGGGLRRAWPLLAAAAYGPVLVAATGLVPAWGRWYTASPFYREQVDALLHGRLALSADPAALRHDLAWAGGGVQQVWGLGVPLWRLVPEAVARWVGAAGFPGMVCFALALSLAAWLVVRALRDPGLPGPPVRTPSLPGLPLAGGALLLLGAPPFVNLLHSRFEIWEEAVAYEYVWGLALAAALVRLAVRPTPRRLGLVCVLAGWGGLVRPTLVLSGFGALAAGRGS
ncbi:MAG: hypothetical protein IH621_16730, partial [Krumholzibacteria bacterium]|nr:hypothetical protein [Candidatus Krumholzibacteria bacterium]